MSLENPFSDIRKAVEGVAEKSAEREFLDKPEERHFLSAFNYFKTIRAIDPEGIEMVIEVAAKSKNMKDEMGSDLYIASNQVLDQLLEGKEEQFNKAVEQIKRTTNSDKEFKEELKRLNLRFLEMKMKEFKKDPRIISSFQGKEGLLNKFVELMSSSASNILESYETSAPLLKEITPREFFEILARRQRGNLTGVELREKIKQEKLTKGLFNRIMQFFRSVK